MHGCEERHQTPLSVPFPMWPHQIHLTVLCSILRLFNWHTGMCGQAKLLGVARANTSALKISGYNSVRLNQDRRHLFGISQLKQAQPGQRGEAGGHTQLLGSFLFQELSSSLHSGSFWLLSAWIWRGGEGKVGLFRPCMLNCKLSQSVHLSPALSFPCQFQSSLELSELILN